MKKKISVLIHLSKIFRNKLQNDHVTAYSAMSAYFLLMSFIPFVMLLLMLAKYLPFSKTDVINGLGNLSFIEDARFLQVIIQAVYEKSNSTVLGITVFALLFTASKCMWGFMKGLNSVYQTKDYRRNIILRLLAILYTITFLLLITAILVLIVFGKTIVEHIRILFPFLNSFIKVFFSLRDTLSIFILTIFFLLLYCHIPNHKTAFRQQIIGALSATTGWIGFSYIFSFYVQHFSNYFELYGGLGIVLLLFFWIYMLMYIIFLGAEINFCLHYYSG